MTRKGGVRERLLRTAADLIWDNGYGAVSVDQICARAGVLKGSFYHFFPSKSDLAVAAIEDHWRRSRAEKDLAFSPLTEPLRRLSAWCALVRENQIKRLKSKGKVVGCPYSSIGSELSALDERVRLKCHEMAERTCLYVETALRDAQREGRIAPGDPRALARELYAFVAGTVQQAKIDNDLAPLDRLEDGVFRLVGLPALADELTQ